MKLLKDLKINGRVDKILNFDKEDEANNTYIVKQQAGSPITLFELGVKENYVSSENDKKNLTFSKVEKVIKDDCVTITIELGNKLSPALQNNTGHNSGNRLDGIIYQLDRESQTHKLLLRKAEKPHVKLEFYISQSPTSDAISPIKKIINLYVADVLFNAIVDFGSEASQACWLKDSPNPESINLTRAIRNASNLNNTKDSEFVQYEHDDTEDINLYRSIYYIKKNLTDDDLNNLDVWPKYLDNTVRFLVRVNEETNDITNNYLQIPNTKILSFITKGYANNRLLYNGDENEIKSIKEGVIPTMVMNNIILQTLLAIENKIKVSYGNGRSCGLILNVLMPNVYPIHIVSQKLNQLAKNIELIKDSIPHINGVELRYISESDASLLGYYNMHTEKKLKEGDCIIVDAGKGTLDFSLMSVNREEGLTNKRRGGIVGAGAAITYGVLVGLVNEYLVGYCKGYDIKKANEKEQLIQNFIYNQILKCKDIAIVNNTMKNIERYKKMYNKFYGKGHGTMESDTRAVGFNDLKLNGNIVSFNNVVESWINQEHNLSEVSAKYVTAEIELIVQEAMKRMTSSLYKEKAKVVVFTGRGCLMKELRVKLKEAMIEHELLENATANELVAEDTMKTGCIHINQLLITGSYDPAESRQSFSILDRFDDSTEKKIKKKTKNEELQEQHDMVDQLREKIEREGLGAMLKGFRTANESFGNLSHGSDLGIVRSAMSLINIGGWIYYIDRRFVKRRCTLFFDGSHYIIVSPGVDPQELDNAVSEGAQVARLGFDSLFPNINTEAAEAEQMVVIPRFERTIEQETTTIKGDREETNTKRNKTKSEEASADSPQDMHYPGERLGNFFVGLKKRLLKSQK